VTKVAKNGKLLRGSKSRKGAALIKRVSNIGIAVRDAATTADAYCKYFGLKREKELAVPEAGVRKSILLRVGSNNFLEIIEPSEDDSPTRRFVDRRGEGLFQVTMVVDRIDEEVLRLEKEKDVTVAYVDPKSTSGVVFELITEAMLDKWGVER
jgi:catechol 2,3-dioxygenase-like lactoylglutathione lyase family enzyme